MDFDVESDGHDTDQTVLHKAVLTRDLDKVKEVLDSGDEIYIYINYLDRELKSPMHLAIEDKLDQIVELLLSTAKNQIRDTQELIRYAISKGNIRILQLLAEEFFDATSHEENMEVFCIAIKEEKFDELDYLLSLLKVDKTNSNNNVSALVYLAVVQGNIGLLEKLLESAFSVNDTFESSPDESYTWNDHAGYSLLHLAVECLNSDIVKLLLNAGAQISKKNDAQSTALHLALEAKLKGIWKTWQDVETNDKIIDILLDATTSDSVKLINSHGISHLHIACSRDEPELIRKFLQNNSISGEDFATSDKQGFACLHFAARYRCLRVAKVLIQYGVDVNQRTNENRTPLHIASKQTSAEVVQLLMQFGADLTLKDCHENTPVHLAFNDRNYEILNSLFTNPTITNSNPTDSAGISHFHIACTRNDVSVIKKFIDAGVDVNSQVSLLPSSDFRDKVSVFYNKDPNWHGCTPLHFGVAFNRLNIVHILLTNGADIHRKDDKGYSPIHVACQQNHDRFGDLVTETLQKWKSHSSAKTLEWMEVQLLNRPYTDVILVYEEAESKGLDPYSRRFPTLKSQLDLMKTEYIRIIDWELNRKDQINVIELLFKHGANLNALDNFGNAPLYYIYDFNIHKTLDLLDEKLCLDKKLGTLIARDFLIEMYHRRLILLNKIFSFDVPINVNMCFNNCSILHYICDESDFWDQDKVDMVKYFLKKKADPNATDDLRLSTPRITLELNKRRCDDPEDKLSNHSTPLHIITQCPSNPSNLAIVCHLLEAGADVNAKQSNGMTALHNLAFHNCTCDEEMTRTLIKYKANLDSRDNQGQTPWFLACLTNKHTSMENFILFLADINIEDSTGRTIFCYFYENLVERWTPTTRIESNTFVTLLILLLVVEIRQQIGLPVSGKVVNAVLKLNPHIMENPRIRVITEEWKAKFKKQVERFKSTKLISNVSLHNVLFLNEHYLSRSLILKNFEKTIYSTEFHDIIFPFYCLVENKYNLSAERKSLLPMAMQTLDLVLSKNFPAFPVVCSDLILSYLRNYELENFIKAYADLTKFSIDNSKIKAYLKIRKAIAKYVDLEYRNEFVVDLIIRKM